ncbi:uncharacterized protein LOC132627672 [Lycium barbarum]|uniref:uncharacterized protein LOC132627672 n=1 Tax=Lycium barbarum TaxID=112863 RepID=UPI00293F6F66|nr:uncharacterized protein LOC132627672 [Lycium barbarum]
MENYSNYSYPDSVNSSPRSREIDCENASWDDQPPNSNYKVKFMCSYGGKIHPRPHDNQLAYINGDTKILSVDRTIRFSNLVNKLSSITDYDVCFKYQLPGEDLDALISVTNEEDLEHMMLEYDRLYRGSAKPARLRLFLFPLSNTTTPGTSTFGSSDSKTDQSQWFVDALNSVQLQNNLDVTNSPTSVSSAPASNPDFLFGLDKGQVQQNPPVKLQDPTPAPPVPEVFAKDFHAGLEDRHIIGDTGITPADYQRQVHEMQRLQQHITNQEQQAMYNRKVEESIPRMYPGEYYQQKAPPPQQAVPVTNPANFWPERHMTSGPYPASAVQTDQQPVYIVQTPAGVYQTPAGIRPVTNQVTGQAYYGVPRVVPEVYREQPVYGGVAPQPTIQQQKMGGAYNNNIPSVIQRVGSGEQTYTQVGYDSVGRQVYYTAQAGVMQQQVQHPVAAVDGRQSGGASNQEGRIVGKP